MRALSLPHLRSLLVLGALLLSAMSAHAQAGTIATGGNHTCAVRADGTAVCWGFGGSGQLGNGATTGHTTPVVVQAVGGGGALSGVTAIAAGNSHTCAVRADGTAVCWGSGGSGRLGNGATTQHTTPVVVQAVGGGGALSNVTAITGGEGHTCARLQNGTAVCWGAGHNGRLGNGATTGHTTPVVVQAVGGGGALSNVTAITAGNNHTCARLEGGTAACWGTGSSGRLGNGATTDQTTPVVVQAVGGGGALSNVTAITGGEGHTCAVRADGTAVCWGSGGSGRLGDGATTGQTTPVVVQAVGGGGALSNVTAITAGNNHTCARLEGGTAACWGTGSSGQLGNGATTGQTMPVVVQAVGGGGALSNVTAITAGNNYTCARLEGGTAACWGTGDSGQLGDGATTQRTTPVAVSGGTSLPVELAAFAALTDGAGRVVLRWTTASETNNAGFHVEHQAPGATAFAEVSFAPGRGTTLESSDYTRAVAGLAPGRHAFRLRQVDFDGTPTYSATVEATVGAGRAALAVYPSPALAHATASLSLPAAGHARVSVYDALGREVALVFEGDVSGGAAVFALPVSSLAPGVYAVRAVTARASITHRFIVAR